MAEVFFYHLQKTPLEQVLPDLLQRTLERGWRAVVRAATPERVERLNTLLWTYDPASFLPHGSRADGHGEAQPVWLTEGDDVPNQAQVLFLVDGAGAERLESFIRVCDLFDGNDEEAVAQARTRWKQAKAGGNTLAYWQQDGGRWTKKAEA
jgi:DNA polymerase-3 subunit chi